MKSSIDPSGVAISDNAQAHIRSTATAVQNAQDVISLINTADSALDGVTDILIRIRNLSLRMANEATANTKSSGDPNKIIGSDQRKMYDEIGSLATEARRVLGGLVFNHPPFIADKSAATYNDKDLFYNEFDTGQNAQIGPDNAVDHTMSIIIKAMTDIADTIPVPAIQLPGHLSSSDFRDFAQIQISAMDIDLEKIGDARELLGTQARRMGHIINDLNQQMISVSDSNSLITDINVAEATVRLKQNLTLQSSFSAAMIEFKDMQASKLEFLKALPTYQD